MIRGRWRAWLVAGSAAATLGASAGSDESTCVTCHEVEEAKLGEEVTLGLGEVAQLTFRFPRPTEEWRGSVHAEHEVSCDACHGGDPREEDAELSMSEEAGFQELPSWKEMAEHCGLCHEAIASRYSAGHFGRRLRAGARVVSCDTCHMHAGHRIVEATPDDVLAPGRCRSCLRLEDPDRAIRLLRAVREQEGSVMGQLAVVEQQGIHPGDLRAELASLHRVYVEVIHEFEEERIAAAVDEAQAGLAGLAERAGRLEAEARRRRRYGAVLLSVLTLLLLGLVGYRRAAGRVA